MRKNEIKQRKIIKYMKIKQKPEYGSNKVFAKLIKLDWSIESFIGNSISFTKWKNIWGDSQKNLSRVIKKSFVV